MEDKSILNKTLLLITDELEKFDPLFHRLKEISPFNVEFCELSSILSDKYKDFFKKNSASNIIIAACEKVFIQSKKEIEDFLKVFYKPFQNYLFLSSNPDYIKSHGFFNQIEDQKKPEHNFFISEIGDIDTQAINFNLFLLQLFKEYTVSSRLSSYITDSAESIVASYLLKQQKEQIEKLNRELEKKNRTILEELMMAQKIQQAIMPSLEALSLAKELRLAKYYYPLENVGGDLYDVIRIGRNGYAIMIADVSGHGVPAALITALAKSSFNFYTHWGRKPSEICNMVNQSICHIIGELGYYFTAYIGMINLENGEFQFTNAGHHAAILYRARTNTTEELNTKGTFIGIFENAKYETRSTHLEEGDKILMLTDGIPESRNTERKIYTDQRVLNFFTNNIQLAPQDLVNALVKDVEDFAEGEPACDDRMVLLLEYLAKDNGG